MPLSQIKLDHFEEADSLLSSADSDTSFAQEKRPKRWIIVSLALLTVVCGGLVLSAYIAPLQRRSSRKFPGNYERVEHPVTEAHKQLHKINLQDRDYIHLGSAEAGFKRVNLADNQVDKRRQNMAAFDKVRVDYCSLEQNFVSLGPRGQILVDYSANSIDYSYNLAKASRKKNTPFKNPIPHSNHTTYHTERRICERTWGSDAPSDWYADATVTIERHGPFTSHGDYDWNSVRKFETPQTHPDQYVLGTFFQPTMESGEVISYPPLHVHHTHMHPYSGKLGSKININVGTVMTRHRGFTEFFSKLSNCSAVECLHEFVSTVDMESLDLRSIYHHAPFLKTEQWDIDAPGSLEHLRSGLLHLFSKETNTKLEQMEENFANNSKYYRTSGFSHHVIIQGHGDGECTVEQGGSDCVLHLLPEGQGYRLSDTGAFLGNYEINDARSAGSGPMTYYIDVGVIAKKLPRTKGVDLVSQQSGTLGRQQKEQSKPKETTFFQMGNPPIGFAWMTYNFPLDYNTNMIIYNVTNEFFGPGTLSNFLLHTHMSFTDSVYVFKGSGIYSSVTDHLRKDGNLTMPFIFECQEEVTVSKESVLALIQADESNQLVCEGVKPSLVLYCDPEDMGECIYRDRRIDFNCVDSVRLEEGETLNVVAFNRVRQTSIKRNKVSEINRDMSYNLKAIYSSFGYHFTAHQHSFFRGDFVSDRAQRGELVESFGEANLDFLLGAYAPPSFFQYSSWENERWGDQGTIDRMTKTCPASISFNETLPWEQ